MRVKCFVIDQLTGAKRAYDEGELADFVDPADPAFAEAQEILRATGVYRTGGGAMPLFRIERAPHPLSPEVKRGVHPLFHDLLEDFFAPRGAE